MKPLFRKTPSPLLGANLAAGGTTLALVYSSDFPFTVLESSSVDYRDHFEAALQDRDGFGLGGEEVEDVMWRNACRFLGLTSDGPGRLGPTARRLVEFHRQVLYAEGIAPDTRREAEAVARALLQPFLVQPAAPASGRPLPAAPGRRGPRVAGGA